jgi:predicted ester cyclase
LTVIRADISIQSTGEEVIMSIEENKAVACRWNDELYSRGNLAAVDELFAADFVWHYAPPGVAPDRDGYKRYVSDMLGPFAAMSCVAEDIVAEGDRVVVRWRWSGTHVGEYMGIAPTGKQVTLTGIHILRIAGGKIVEEWGESDNLGFMEQLGAKLG